MFNWLQCCQKVQGIEIPYYEVVYDDGTVCDLTGEPRRTTVHYVCQPDGRGEVYELKETSSCEYEVIVLTALLCPHDAYGFVFECDVLDIFTLCNDVSLNAMAS